MFNKINLKKTLNKKIKNIDNIKRKAIRAVSNSSFKAHAISLFGKLNILKLHDILLSTERLNLYIQKLQ